MDYQEIIYEDRGAIVRIWHNRPQVRNAENQQLLEELDHAVSSAGRDPNVRVIILAGKGDHFSAGHDMKEPLVKRPNQTVEQRWEYEVEHFYDYCLRIFDVPKPTIAQVQGACIAGGFMVANMCDLVIASEDAVFSDPVGQTLGAAAVEMLIHPWVLGARKAKEMLFTGRPLTAADAFRLGMVNQVVPREQLDSAVLEFGEQIAKASPFTLKLIKRSINRTLDAQGFRTAISAHFDTHQLSHVSDENRKIFEERRANAAGGGKTSFGRSVSKQNDGG